jgi:hypothetical protein
MQEIMAKTPDALDNRERVVALVDGGAIVVRRWNYAREMACLKLVSALVGRMDFGKLQGDNPIGAIGDFIATTGEQITPIIQVSLDKDDFARWDDLAPVDRIEIILALYEVNRIGDYVKKVREAWSRFQPNAKASEKRSQ